MQYLLGELPEDERQQFDEQLITNADYSERLMATEDELIDDYLLGQLSEGERERFERTFLTNPFLRKRVALAKALLDYIDSSVAGADALGKGFLYSRKPRYPSSHPFKLNKLKSHLGTELVPQGLEHYRVSLYVIAVVRVTILALLWFFIYLTTFASSLHSPIIFYVLTVLFALYVPLEAVSLHRAVKDARLAFAESQAETDPS